MAAQGLVRWQGGDEETADNIIPTGNDSADVIEFKTDRSYPHRHPRIRIPAAALPIQYRSVSFEIDESERRVRVDRDKAKNTVVFEFESIDWHTLSIREIEKRLEVDASRGLANPEVTERLERYGKNKVSQLPNPWFWKVMGYLFKGFGSILFIGSTLVFISWKPLGEPPAVANLALGIVLFAVFVIQAAFNSWQDFTSSQVMASITAMLPESCFLLRDGARVEVSATDIVPGDIIFIKAGNRVPADLRFINVSHDASFDRSILTGESKSVKAKVESTDDNYLETHCIGLQGTHCVSGHATGIIVATGDTTVFGRIAKLTGKPKTGLTTIEKEILRFVLLILAIMITWIIILASIWAGWLHKDHPNFIDVPTLIVDCVSVAIAYIPEGLPIAVTAGLTITANTMRKNKILCKSLKTVESLGSVSIICSDKTGTLTQNMMFVTHCAVGTTEFTADSAKEDLILKMEGSAIQEIQTIAGLCNVAEFDTNKSKELPLSERRIFGDATDQAALRFSESLRPISELRSQWKTCFELGFDSKNKFMIKAFTLSGSKPPRMCLSRTELADLQTGSILFTVKGAPDILIERCSQFLGPDGKTGILTDETRSAVKELKDRWSADGKRVILLARKVINVDQILHDHSSSEFEADMLSQAKTGLVLVGLLGLIDPPRAEIPGVIATLRGAGIRICMVTGDYWLTALAVARQCGIVSTHSIRNVSSLARYPDEQEVDPTQSALLLSGAELMTLNDHQWEQLCRYPEIVFSRMTPDLKLRIVRELQARGEIVGMTGDGVNDAPALNAADIGISLASGSDIAIEAADMVLLDSFAAIVEAVRYGRVVFDNLKKIIAYLLPAGSWSEFWPVFTNLVFGLPQVLSSFLMIIICCFTDCAAAIMLTYEAPEADVLRRPPRHPKKDRLVNWQLMFHSYAFIGMIESICSFSMAYWYLQQNGIPFSDLWFSFGQIPQGINPDYYNARVNEASSIYFINLVIMQWFNLMAVRTRHFSIFQHPPAFNKRTQNLLLFPAILFALGVAVIWLYIPQLQVVLSTSDVPVAHYFLPAALGVGLLCLDEGRKAGVRRWPNSILAKMAW